MKLERLSELWREQHSGGKVWRNDSCHFNVTYAPGGKVYRYRASSVYALAERLELIPQPTTVEVTARVLDQLQAVGDSVVDLAGAGDTLRYRLQRERDGVMVDSERAGVDEYGRQLSEYTLFDDSAFDEWIVREV